MRTFVAGLQPTIFATFAIGTPASSIRDTAVCRRSWKRQARDSIFFSSGLASALSAASPFLSSGMPFRIFAPRSFPCFLHAVYGLSWVRIVCLRLKLLASGSVPFCGEHIVLGLVLGEVACPKTQGCHCARVEWDDSSGP